MSKTSALIWGAVILAVMVAVGQGSHQDWELSRHGDSDRVRFTIRRFEPGHGRWVSTSDVPFSRFHGVSSDTIDHGGKAQFEYVQDAGKLVCSGRFYWGKGSGSFTFVPNPQFTSELQKLGYDAPAPDKIFPLMLSGISLEFARAVKDAGVQASIEQLVDLESQGVTLEYIRDVRAEGYTDFSAKDFIEMRNNGVRVSFLRALKDAGYTLSAREIVELANQGVDGDYLHQVQSYGLHPSARELVQFRNQGVTPQFLDGLKAAGYETLTPGEIVELHNNGVPGEFARAAHDLGYHFSSRELVELRNNGVDSKYLQTLRDSGMRSLSAGEIVKLRNNGVD